jgi:hypothetical protein
MCLPRDDEERGLRRRLAWKGVVLAERSKAATGDSPRALADTRPTIRA